MPRRYLSTHARLSQEAGRIDCTTRTWTRQPWVGFTGGATVLLGAGNGELVHNTDLLQFGVDGFRIPFKTWTRQDYWVQPVPRDVAMRTQVLEIVHTHAPKDRFFRTLEDIKRTATLVADIAEQIRRIRFS